MSIHRFTANTAREALSQVKETLGPDAMILANKNVANGVEITACSEDEFTDIVTQKTQKTQPEPRHEHHKANPEPALHEVMQEIRGMRDALENRISDISWGGGPTRPANQIGTLKELLSLGFSASLARYLTEKAPMDATVDERMLWAGKILTRNLSTLQDENEFLDKGGVYALIGPTGVGKTTTTAKLAARCVMRHGPQSLALITTDAYRIGAHEQLRIYGKILGVMVHSVKDEVDLRIALNELQNKHTVLIDTMGMSQRDQMVTEQIAMLSGGKVPVKRLLCMNSTSTIDTLNEVVSAYRGTGLEGCILTKLDEAPSLCNALDVVLRHKLRLYYVGTGQRVPEDLELVNASTLVTQAFTPQRHLQTTQYEDNELSVVMSALHQSPEHLRSVNIE